MASESANFVESVLGISQIPDLVLVIFTIGLAVLIGIVLFLWRRSSSSREKASKPVESLKHVSLIEEDEVELDPGKTKVTILFGTQIGTAEGFAKFQCACLAFPARVPTRRFNFNTALYSKPRRNLFLLRRNFHSHPRELIIQIELIIEDELGL